MVVAGELGELLDHDAASRHVDTDRERLGGEHDLDQALDETASTTSLNGGTIPAWWAATPASSCGHELGVAEHVEIGVDEAVETAVGDLADPDRARSSSVSRIPAATQSRAASSHWARLKMK